MPDVNLNPFTAESAAIQRRLQMAQALGQQALQPMDLPQQAGVRASPYAGLAKILQAYNAAQSEKSATQEYKDLAERYQAGNRAEMGSFLEAMQGTPAKELAGPAPQGAPQGVSQTEVTQPYTDAQGVQYKGGEPIQGGYIQPEQKPDRTRAMALALGSQTPTLHGAGGAMLSQMFAQDKIKDFKVELVGQKTHRIGYTETGKRIDLGPITESVSPDTAARLKQDKEQADRAFSQLSAKDKATLANDAARLNISAQQLFFDTGIKAGGGSFVNPFAQPPAQPNVAPNAPPVVPPAGGRYTPFNAPQRAATPPTPTTPTNVAPQPESNLIIDQVTPKERQVLLVAKPQAITGATTSLQNIDRLTNVAKELSDHPGLSRIAGKLNQFSTFDATAEATSARALQSTLVKQAAVNALQSMREASKTGGAVGAVTEGEWPILEQQLAALDGAQKPQDYKIALTNLQAQLKSSSKRIRDAYEMTYGPLPYTAPQYTTQGRDAPPAGAVRRIR